MKDSDFRQLLVDHLKKFNAESHFSHEQKLELAFKRALDQTTPSHAGRAADHPDSPNNPYKVYYEDRHDPDDGWL